MLFPALKAFLAKRSRSEVRVLFALAMAAGGILVFLKIADEIIFEKEHALDRMIVAMVRAPGSVLPFGPPWLEEVARDITSLGSTSVLTLITFGAAMFLLLSNKTHSALYVTAASVGGTSLVQGLKALFGRERPDIVPEVAVLASKSFPSGHATMSAIIYLTLAVLIARTLKSLRLRAFAIAIAILVTLLVGLSRIYLGYHWPSDVAAGWTLGAAWALVCWSIAEWIEGRLVRRED